jgi:MFS family permease
VSFKSCVISSMFASGAVLSLLLGGIIIQNWGWHATFLSAIPIAIALLVQVILSKLPKGIKNFRSHSRSE